MINVIGKLYVSLLLFVEIVPHRQPVYHHREDRDKGNTSQEIHKEDPKAYNTVDIYKCFSQEGKRQKIT